MKFKVAIKGIAPLLQHRFDPDKLTDIKKKRGDKKLSDAEKRLLAEQFLYRSGKKVVQPSSHIEGAMIKAATELRLSGSGKKTYKDLVKSSVFVFPEMIPHKNQDWTIDERAAVNPTTRGRTMCYRPRFEEWALEFEMEVNDDRADADAIKEILTIAGVRNGIGSYRPRFGRFEIVKFEEVK